MPSTKARNTCVVSLRYYEVSLLGELSLKYIALIIASRTAIVRNRAVNGLSEPKTIFTLLYSISKHNDLNLSSFS